MSKSRFREISVTSLAILLTIATAKPAASFSIYPFIAQSPNLPMPTTVPSGTTVNIDGSNSMVTVNQTLKQRFESRFPNTTVQISDGGTDVALQALRKGEIDLAAIGRPLTAAEKNEGLVLDPLSRPKIAIVVGEGNPFKGSLTTEQFAKIFRGEITDWSEVGRAAGKIRLIDRPETSDTRQAF
jgi:phosphate transport system substrate-binding protein